ncbi:MAG: HD domain-containing protein [Nitrososphaerota archaeon]|jgi:3'-5' exoribonuclease|nr:HD domain-containing protein [Nitrososphaerota archaeon]
MLQLDLKQALNKKEGEIVNGIVYVTSAYPSTTVTGVNNVSGYLTQKNSQVYYQVWGDNIEPFKRALTANRILTIAGKINRWFNPPSINITFATPDTTGLTISDFITTLNLEKLEQDFYQFIECEISPKTRHIINEVITGKVKERFFTEIAAKNVHDAVIGGLANHTNKMLQLAKVLIDNDNRLKEYTDLIYCGIIFHDIGKIQAYNNGQNLEYSYVDHRSFGCELLQESKQKICNLQNTTFYYQLLAIIQGHHNQYGDKAKTVWAYLIHLIDTLEAYTTMILDRYEANLYTEHLNGEKSIKYDNDTLYY